MNLLNEYELSSDDESTDDDESTTDDDEGIEFDDEGHFNLADAYRVDNEQNNEFFIKIDNVYHYFSKFIYMQICIYIIKCCL